MVVMSEGSKNTRAKKTLKDHEDYEQIQQSALWQGLPAVKNGNVHLLDADKYYNSDIITIRETMKEVAEMLASDKTE